jgi:hypothetical protein
VLEGLHAVDVHGAGGGGRAVGREVLEHDDALEEGVAGRDVTPPLDRREGGLLVLLDREAPRLDVAQPLAERLPGSDVGSEGQGVDEEADAMLDAGQVGGATGDGHAEDDVGRAHPSGEHDRPGAEERRAERHPPTRRCSFQVPCRLLVEFDVQ